MIINFNHKEIKHTPIWRTLLATFMLSITITMVQAQRPENQKPNTNKDPVQLDAAIFDNTNTGDQIKNAQNVSDFLVQMVKNQRLTTTDTDYVITSEHISSLSGIQHIYYRQAINGIEIQGTEASMHIAGDGTLAKAHSNNLIKDVNSTVKSSSASLSAQQAIHAIASQMNYGNVTNLKEITSSKSVSNTKLFNNGGISGVDIPAKQMYYLIPDDGIRMIWEISIQELNSSDWWNFRVDANTGTIIDKYNFTQSCNIMGDHSEHNHDTPVHEEICEDVVFETPEIIDTVEEEAAAFVGSYLVYALPLESPYFGARTVVTNPEDLVASPFGWHDTNGAVGSEFTTTRGNNTITVDDIDDNNTGGQTANGGAGLVFNFPFDQTQTQAGIPNIPFFSAANRSLDAAITNTFYWTNIIHDITYQYGFDEASGNFQQNNYGNGGVGNDQVLGDVQDGSGTCNANFGTPPEGNAPRMQMFSCGNNDGDYDNLVIIHEYAHGISTRLTGGSANSGSLNNQEQQGEGWSDYYGYMYTMDASNATSNRAVGTFLIAQGPNGNGIRSFPYSPNMGVNPQTYQSMINLGNGGGVAPHAVGEIWATMLYDLTQALIAEHGFDPDLYNGTGGNNISLALVTEGLKLQPASPGFVDSRDAILLADQLMFGGANQCIIWESFAARGLGFSANQGSSNLRADGTQAFDVPPITLAVTETNVCLANGAVSLGGGVVNGGTYSGPGVSDDGNGATFTFDPAAAGVGNHIITYSGIDCNGIPGNDTDTITVTEVLPEISSCPDVTLALGADGTVTYDPFTGGLNVDMVGGNDAANADTQGFTIFFVPGASITQTTTVSFDWELVTAGTDAPEFDSFGYILGTTVFTLSPDVDPIESGTFSIEVPAGQNFGFAIITDDNTFGAATATVSNFSPGYSGQFATANWQELNQMADGTASFSGTPAPSLVSCGELTTSLSQSVFTCLDIGTTTSVTVTVTDSLGNEDTCMADVTITGSALNTTTFTGGAWNNGDPTGTSMAIISDEYDTATLGDINACSCQIDANQIVTIRDGDFMNVAGNIVVDGTLIVENTGSVVQLDNNAITTNNGTIQVQKTTPLLAPRDFVVLGSPMSGETRSGVYGSANRVFEIVTSLFTPDPAVTSAINFVDVDFNYFQTVTNLTPGEGYLVFPQATSAVGNVTFDHTYTQGTLNSGTLNYPLVYNGPATMNNFNVVGNPYASALDNNMLIGNNAVINELYFWEHLTQPNDTNPGANTLNFSMDDISVYNLLGGIAAVNGGSAPGQFMPSGQGFGIVADQAFSGSSTPLTFTNDMRVTGNNGTVRSAEIDMNRLWLRLSNETLDIQSTTLLGFTSITTSELDPGYDSPRLDATINLFSTLDSGEALSIQAREAFDSNMEIDLGFSTQITESETYTISIDHLEGIGLELSDVYLIDNELGNITNLKDGPYTFTASESIQSSRFTLVFEDRLLDVDDASSLDSGIRVFPNPATNQITLSYAGDQRLTHATIIDLNGKILNTIDLTNFDQSRSINTGTLATGVYFIRVQSVNSTVVKRLLIN